VNGGLGVARTLSGRWNRVLRDFVAVGVLLALPFTPAAMTGAGTGGSDPIVSDSTGAASLRIPIAVPPGPGGFAPNLALSYSSRAGDGPFGVGWGLGLPEIRCSDRFGVPNLASCQQYLYSQSLQSLEYDQPRM